MVVDSNPMHVRGYDSVRPLAAAEPETHVTLADLGFEALFDRLLDAVVIARLSTGRIVMWNSAAEKLFGYAPDEVIGKPLEMLMPEPISHIHRAGVERYMRTGHGLIIDADAPVEMPARMKSGEEIRVELALGELRAQDGDRFAVAVIRNAMLRKQLELTTLDLTQERVARSVAEAAVEARDELLDSLAATLQASPRPDQLERLVSLLGTLKDVRLGLRNGRPIDIDVVDVVHAAIDAARRRIPRKRLVVHLPPSAAASCDPARLRLVLDLILDDLLERAADDARVELSVEQPSLHIVPLVARVRTSSAQPRAASVGLLVSRLLVQQMDGTMRIERAQSASLQVALTVPASRRERRAVTRRRSH